MSEQLTILPNGLADVWYHLCNDHLLHTIYRGGVFSAYKMWHKIKVLYHQMHIFEENPNLVVTSWYLSQLGCKTRNPCGNPVAGNLTFSNLDGSTCSWTHFLRGSWICKGKCLSWPVWPYMAIPSNTQVLYMVWNSFSMWIQWWCPCCNQSDHIWQNH